MLKTFLKFVLPSMLAFAFSGVYAIVDGFFVGRNIGDAGLAAINIAYPITALIQAVGTGIGMGGAIYFSINKGRQDEKRASGYAGNTMVYLLFACILLTIFLACVHYPALELFGAEGEILTLANEYIRVIIVGTTFQLLSTGLVPLLRNHGKAIFAMGCMVAGFVTNIVLDYLFIAVLPFGMAGAAWATIIGQAVTMVPCLLVLFSKKYRLPREAFKPQFGILKEIISTGISPFGLTLSPNIVLLIMNKTAMLYGGTLVVASYAVISYVSCVVQLLLQGVGDGSQPLLSRYIGEKNVKSAGTVCKMAYILAAVVALLCGGVMIALRYVIPPFFGASPQVTEAAAEALPVFAAGFLFIAFLRVTTSYFYASGKNRFAYILVYGEPALLFLLLTFVFPRFWGLTGVWISVPVTQMLLSGIGFYCLKRKGNKPDNVPDMVLQKNFDK